MRLSSGGDAGSKALIGSGAFLAATIQQLGVRQPTQTYKVWESSLHSRLAMSLNQAVV